MSSHPQMPMDSVHLSAANTPDAAPAVAYTATAGQLRRAIFASVVGNGLEWFDFLIYGYFSRIIAATFFPTVNATLSLILTLATFAVGFVVRPIGGIIVGAYADRVGRSKALSLIIMLMAFSTLLMGVTPGYAQIGLLAPALVIVSRALQGLSVGGQFSTASALLVEYAPPGRKMFYGSFNMSAQALALLLSAGVGYLLTANLSHEHLTSWGWRIPFLCGIIAGPLGMYIRHRVGDGPEFQQMVAQQPQAQASDPEPVRSFFRHNGRAVLCAMGVIIVGAATNYVSHSYLAVYLHRLHLPLEVGLRGAFLSGVMNLFLYPLAGRLMDRFGPYRLFYPIIIIWMLCLYPLFAFLVADPSPDRLLFVQVVSTVFLAAMSGGHPGMLSTLFPPRHRSTGAALAYNLAVTLFGGLAPLTITVATQWTGSNMTPAFYIIVAGFVSLVLVFFSRRGPRGVREFG